MSTAGNIVVNYAGEATFGVFMDIVSDTGCKFIDADAMNTGDFSYFYRTGKFDPAVVMSILSYKSSLSYALNVLEHLSGCDVSFYFGVKGFDLEYGFLDETMMVTYKVGRFFTTSRFVKNMYYSCMVDVKKRVNQTNLKNVSYLRKNVELFTGMFPGVNPLLKIVDEKNVVSSFEKKVFKEDDLNVDVLNNFLSKWLMKNNKYGMFYANVVMGNDVNFQFKLKDNVVITQL